MSGLAMAAAMLAGGAAMQTGNGPGAATGPGQKTTNQQVQRAPRSSQQQPGTGGASQTANPNQQRSTGGTGSGASAGISYRHYTLVFGNGRGHRDQKPARSHRNLIKHGRSLRRRHAKAKRT